MGLYQYILRRLLLIVPTLFGITLIVFVIINLAPGSPVEQKIMAMRFGGGAGGGSGGSGAANQGVSEEVMAALNKQYGFDKPLLERYRIWLGNISRLDFGESFTFEEPVIDVITGKFPVSLQFGIVSLILTYLISIPMGVYKAIHRNGRFDVVSGVLLNFLYAIPPFMLGILFVVFLAGGSFLDIFPIGGLYSDDYSDLDFGSKILDRVHHFILPLTCYVIGHFATLTLLMKNSMLEEMSKDYVRTAKAKGLSDTKVYFKHAFRNALIPIVTGLGSFLSVFFAGSLLLETVFQLDGIGLLSYNSVLARDYNVIMGLTFLQSVLFLVGNLLSDLAYLWVDPRINFS